MATTLTGNEVLQITGVDNLGRPSGSTETVSSLQLAIYANSGASPSFFSWSATSATGTTQLTAALIGNTVLNLVIAGGLNSGVILPVPFNSAGTAAQQLYAINGTANNILLYPPVGMSINSQAVNVPFTMPPGLALVVIGLTTTSWSVGAANVAPGFVYNINTSIGSTVIPSSNIVGPFGFQDVTLAMTGALTGAATLTMPAAGSVLAGISNPFVGQTWRLRIINESSNNQTCTVSVPSAWSLGGTATISQNTWRDFYVSIPSAATIGLQSIGTGTYS